MDESTVAAVLAFARAGSDRYDDIATRYSSAPHDIHGPLPVHPLGRHSLQQKEPEVERLDRLMALRHEVRALSFDFQGPADADFKYLATDRELRLRWTEGTRNFERWISRADLPAWLLQHTEANPEGPLLAHRVSLSDGDVWWLPLPSLIAAGRFVRMQEDKGSLTNALRSDRYYVFVSHRWLDSEQPDPDGGQAASVAWQLIARVIEAVWVGAARGHRAPRLRSPLGPMEVGPRGSVLAESLLVNLLAPLDEGTFAELAREAQAFDDIEVDGGVSAARGDRGLQHLRARLADTPQLRELISRILIWYDYACMPQYPRTNADQKRFERMLRRLDVIQSLGHTVVLLDDVVDYFGRGWCSFESALAKEGRGGQLDVWSGSLSEPASRQERRWSFLQVATDRPHLIWRAILDTEVFGVQSPAECMARLELETTRPEDLAIVYGLLRDLGAPGSVHSDNGEVLTGVITVPQDDRHAIFQRRPLQFMEPLSRPTKVHSINWTGALDPRFLGRDGLSPWVAFDVATRPSQPRAHVAVSASCEGEAMLIADWVRHRRQDIEAELGVTLCSVSWVASDIAPVGHFACAKLAVRPVGCDLWIVVASHAQHAAGYVTQWLVETLCLLGMAYVQVEVDRTRDNCRFYAASSAPKEADEALVRLALDAAVFSEQVNGGLFRDAFLRRLGGQP